MLVDNNSNNAIWGRAGGNETTRNTKNNIDEVSEQMRDPIIIIFHNNFAKTHKNFEGSKVKHKFNKRKKRNSFNVV